jgi:uncharacterized protein YndB with AHSA1/START domain
MNPDLDLALARVIRASRTSVWDAWTDPAYLERWWAPAPAQSRVDRLELRPGGGFVTRLSEDGTNFIPQLDACFIVVEDLRRIVFTNAIDSAWRPAQPAPVPMTAEIRLDDHPDGTSYQVVVRHGDPTARAHHEKLGFIDGWAAITAQLTTLAENGAVR